MKNKKTYQILEGALRKGNVIHAFLSGGGLRVIRVEKGRRGKLTGYGEHPHVDEALRHAAEDFAAGGRPYSEVYGSTDWDNPEKSKKGIYAHYLTGDPTPNSELDAIVRRGNTFDCRFVNGQFEVDIRGWGEMRTPDDVVERVTRTGVSETFRDERGNEFEASFMRFPGNGEAGCSTRPINVNPKYTGNRQHRLWMWHTSRVGQAGSLQRAFEAAFAAKPVEIEDE